MEKNTKTIYVDVAEVCADWGVSKSKGYAIIKKLAKQLLEQNPNALVISGKINRKFYEEVCLKNA